MNFFSKLILNIYIFYFLFQIIKAQSLPKFEKLRMIRAPQPSEPVIIVGGGLSGLTAALEVLNQGSNVVLFDKEKDFGGNSIKASSGISACNTKFQKALGIEDSIDKCFSDIMSAGDRENDATLVDILVHKSTDALNFLSELGLNLSDVNLCGAHSVPRLHWLPASNDGKLLPVGLAIIRALKFRLLSLKEKFPKRIDLRLNTSVVGLVTWNEYVTGVRFKNKEEKIEELNGKSVILATGGFSNDNDKEFSLLNEFATENILKLPSTNGLFATGDGIKMARAMGAAVVGMQYIQVHPTSFIDPNDPLNKSKFLAAEALRGKGAILINQQGKRFCNELGRRDHITQSIQKYCLKNKKINNWNTAFMLMNDEAAYSFGYQAFSFYAKTKNFFITVQNVNELSQYTKIDVETLKSTLSKYNLYFKDSKSGIKDEFGKSVFPVSFDINQPFHVAIVTPAIHYTIGGLKIDHQAFVFSEFMKKPFKGLLAAGEVTGGVHGRNRLAGNSLLECIVFGRIAGQSAAQIIYSHDEL